MGADCTYHLKKNEELFGVRVGVSLLQCFSINSLWENSESFSGTYPVIEVFCGNFTQILSFPQRAGIWL